MSSKKSAVIGFLPNNYEEQPQVIEGKAKVFKEKVASKVDELETLGTFLTIFQYVLVLVVILVLVLSRIFQGTTVSYSELKPSYSKFLELNSDADISNMKCLVTNDTLTYNSFTTYSYEKADACEWVKADLEKPAVQTTENIYTTYTVFGSIQNAKITRRDTLGKTSACKSLKKDATCKAINEDCVRGHAAIEQLLLNMGVANFPLKELLDSESKLLTFVNSTLTQSFQSLLSGLEGPRIAVEQWAAKNMPVIYGYFGSLSSNVQGLAFRSSDYTSRFYKSVQTACTVYNIHFANGNICDMSGIGNGRCNTACNNPYCLHDGGDCMNAETLFEGNSNAYWDGDDYTGNGFKFRAFSPLQQGDFDIQNPYYDTSNVAIYNAEVKTALKTLKDGNDHLLIDLNDDGTVTDEEVDTHLANTFKDLSWDSSIWQSLPNYFVGFDPNSTCGDSSTWYKSYEMDRPPEWLSGLEAMYNFVFRTCLKDTIYPSLGFPPGVSVPSGEIPIQSTDVFSCDALSQSHNLPGVVGFTTAEIKNWVDYLFAVFDYFKDQCGAGANVGEWQTDCPSFDGLTSEEGILSNFRFPAALLGDYYDSARLLSVLEYTYFASAARENSGSISQLLLDAGIKRDSKGYNVEAIVDFEAYYLASDVSECTYSKKVGANPATVVTVVLGLIGGVTTSVSFFAIALYQILRKNVLKKSKKEVSEDSSAI